MSAPCAFAALKATDGKDTKDAKKKGKVIEQQSSNISGSASGSGKKGMSTLSGEGWSTTEEQGRRAHIKHLVHSKRILSTGDPERFGTLFYEDLFKNAEPLRVIFEGKDLGMIANAFGRIPIEMLRLIMLSSKSALVAEMYRMGLRHVDYGAQRSMYGMFEASMIRTLNRHITREGGKFDSHVENGWKFVLRLVSDLLFTYIEANEAKVNSVRSSWNLLLATAKQQARENFRFSGGGGVGNLANSNNPNQAKGNNNGKNYGNRGKQSHSNSTKKSSTKNVIETTRVNRGMANNNIVNLEEEHSAGLAKLGGDLTKILRRGLSNKRFEWGPEHGMKLGLALELIVSTVTLPKKLEQELWRLAQKHLELGVHASDLEVFEIALFSLLKNKSDEKSYMEMLPNWKWLWDNVKHIFVDVLEKWKIMQRDLMVSWELLLTRAGNSVAISDHFYGRLFRDAPLLQDIFQRRNETMVDSFAKALDMIVRCSQDSSLFDKELEELAVRHCKFDLQSWHFDIFGEILLASLSEIVGEAWVETYDVAWRLLYNSISNVFLGVLDTSRNPMCNALVRGSVEGALKALESAPRIDRVSRVLMMKAGKRTLSPILWALRDGILPVAELFFDDVMAIRTDREQCYYGMQELWVRCPMILEVLVESSPQLVEQFLDGHMWVSKTTIDGHRRVNLWVKYIYGDPTIILDVFKGPLGVLCSLLPENYFHVFLHPVVVAAVEIKWDKFGLWAMLSTCLMQLVALVMYCVVSTAYDALGVYVSFAVCIAWLVVTAYIFVRTMWTVYSQIRSKHVTTLFEIRGRAVKLSRCLTHFYVQLRLACCVLSFFYIGYVVTYSMPPSAVGSILAFLQWIQLSEFFKLNRKLAAVFYLGRAMLQDALRFMIVLFLWFLAIGAALHHLIIQDPTYEYSRTSFETPYVLLANMLGMGDDADLTYFNGEGQLFVRFFYMMALWVAIIPILNLMVAAMVSTYSKADAMTVALAVRARATAVMEAEYELRTKTRLAYFNAFGFDEPLPFTALDKGPPGGITQLRTPQHLKTHASYGRREDKVLFFSGSVDPNDPWPPHSVPQLRANDDGGSVVQYNPTKDLADLKTLLAASNTANAEKSEIKKVSPVENLHVEDLVIQEGDEGADDEEAVTKMHMMPETQEPVHLFISIEGVIYDAVDFLPRHPGGKEYLLKMRGKDATANFLKMHNNVAKARASLALLPKVGYASVVTDDMKGALSEGHDEGVAL